ncbi:hypothetical protein BS1321_07320 [Peribacillus simplex NBRC 15720 = DSM 1321]|uniref:Uncharacterized protein n=1 Tax=Peribacillus simplex NBRC 15720 = DSM 1321 TaxID=1349754 RepID=A0A223EEW6_9BACI|nr:hypothetical protein [Peribacillus simplex]ASS93797.1 hypothetical protein BS1321_07320 [Peribacillus simplex NBRC 15720 = DSM 1321]CAH0212380.1 hypothetical protein SRABI84_02174 [Peribacillus simplex]
MVLISTNPIVKSLCSVSNIPGIAIDNNCAFVIMDDKYRIIKSDPQNKVFLFNNIRGVTEKKEPVSEKYKPLTEIF